MGIHDFQKVIQCRKCGKTFFYGGSVKNIPQTCPRCKCEIHSGVIRSPRGTFGVKLNRENARVRIAKKSIFGLIIFAGD